MIRYESFKGKNQTGSSPLLLLHNNIGWEYLIAWNVSLHPSGETYASTGQAGNVHIHSAKTSFSHPSEYDESTPFGTHLSTLDSGRAKFGMFLKHVRPPAFSKSSPFPNPSSMRLLILSVWNVMLMKCGIESRRTEDSTVKRIRDDIPLRPHHSNTPNNLLLPRNVRPLPLMVSRLPGPPSNSPPLPPSNPSFLSSPFRPCCRFPF